MLAVGELGYKLVGGWVSWGLVYKVVIFLSWREILLVLVSLYKERRVLCQMTGILFLSFFLRVSSTPFASLIVFVSVLLLARI